MDSLNNITASFQRFVLDFNRPSGTSRGILTQKKGWKLFLNDHIGTTGLGECSIIPGLSPDYIDDRQYEQKLNEVCANPYEFIYNPKLLSEYPSILFGLESAYLDLKNGGKRIYFESATRPNGFTIPINGLIWMGKQSFMQEQITEKIAAGFSCIKLKIGALDFKQEVKLLEGIRATYDASQITLRVDANGAFSMSDALWKLQELAALELHSIEQPIKAGNWEDMTKLCVETPLPIALDEELIGIHEREQKIALLNQIKPQYIILKPSLHGGISGTSEWIHLAEERNIQWWITSALESNIGLNTIAQFTATFDTTIPQGLGTGGLYVTNFEAPLTIEKGNLIYQK